MEDIAPVWSAIVISLAVVVGVARLWLWRARAPADARAAPRRLALLSGLQIMAGLALFLTLHPPAAGARNVTMVVATRDTSAVTIEENEILVALPEAGVVPRAERVPDLASALRRHPEAARLRVLGEGLPARDRDALALPVDAETPPPATGFVEIALPAATAPGAAFTIGGRVGALTSGTVELVDPAGVIVARTPVATGRRFLLNGAARAEGTAVFELRLRDVTGRLTERLDVPLLTRADRPPRVIALAGAPGPEINFLRRWVNAAGVDLAVGIDLGAGVRLGEAPLRLTTEDLARTDLLVVDDRGWEALDTGARSLVTRAVEGGMGLLLRPTATLGDATRREWVVRGAPIAGDGELRPLPIPNAEGVPEIARWPLAEPQPEAVSGVQAADGSSLARWRARGRGRIGVWTVLDSYVLALAGRPEAHADLWSEVFSALGRPLETEQRRLLRLARVGDRAVVCSVGPGDVVRAPDGAATRLLIDRNAGLESCAAFWPSQAGWHLAGSPDGSVTPLYIHAADAAPSLNAYDGRPAPDRPAPAQASQSAGPALMPILPFAALLILFAALWFTERRKPSRDRKQPTTDGSA
ncbi:MAG TPA: hypothetical protein VLJ13_01595 [Brevundimonas sp.]|nr:hypothetical protein [Brevundimonas sp.]